MTFPGCVPCTAAKAKVQNLQLQKMKEADQKKKQMELMKSQEGKKAR
jgi:hypothetical protein